jgi:hypothetical protein
MLGSNPGLLRLRHWQSEALTTQLDLIHKTQLHLIHNSVRSHPQHSARSHPPTRLDLIHSLSARYHPQTRLDLIHNRLDLIHNRLPSARPNCRQWTLDSDKQCLHTLHVHRQLLMVLFLLYDIEKSNVCDGMPEKS